MKISLISTSTYPSDQGLRTISSCLKQAGHQCQIIFLNYKENYSVLYSKKILKQLLSLVSNSDLIGISAYASTSPRASQVIKYLKKLQKPIVYGGVHATFSPEKCIKETDIVCIGEAEQALIEFVNKLEKKQSIEKIKNFWIKKQDKIIKNPVRPLLEDIDSLPYPDYDFSTQYLIDKGKIRNFKESDLNGQIFFLTGRGCPYQCTYCTNALLKKIYKGKGQYLRFHSIPYMIKHLEEIISKYPSIKYFDIRDDTFFARPLSHFQEFNLLYKEKIKLRFKCLATPTTVAEEKIKLFVDAGCTDIIIGIQGSERVNNEIYLRPQTDSQVLKAASILNKYKNKLAVMYDVITCNPYENPQDIINLIRLLQKIPKPYFLSVNNLIFFTGSELYRKAKADGIIKTETDSAFNLNYWDRFKHIKLKKKNAYLVLILNLMRGVTTSSRYGFLPNSLINFLLKPSLVNFNLKNKFPTYIVGNLVQTYDTLRENIAKPFYRSLPVSFKVWYDKIRYRI